MAQTASLTITLSPELRDQLQQLADLKRTDPAALAADILSRALGVDPPAAGPPGGLERRRQGRAAYDPQEAVADIQRSLEALGLDSLDFGSDGAVAAEVEAVISRTESDRDDDR